MITPPDTLRSSLSPLVSPARRELPTPGDEYTPAQRRIIDRGIAKGVEDIKKGRVHGPFENAEEAIAHLKAHVRRRKKTASHKTS